MSKRPKLEFSKIESVSVEPAETAAPHTSAKLVIDNVLPDNHSDEELEEFDFEKPVSAHDLLGAFKPPEEETEDWRALVNFLRARFAELRDDADAMKKSVSPKALYVVPSEDIGDKPIVGMVWGGRKQNAQVDEQIKMAQEHGHDVWSPDRAATILARCDAAERIITRAKVTIARVPNETACDALVWVLMNMAQEFKDFPGFKEHWRM